MKLLVTGGAGYIGSHVVRQLGETGHELVIYDSLVTGFRDSVLYGELVVGDLADRDKLEQVLGSNHFDAILHFAAHIVVPESVENPLKYYGNNTRNTLGLIESCQRFGVNQFVFSSTAAVYGMPEQVPVAEEAPLAPINPYGWSKRMSEQMLMDAAAAGDLRYVILRYFNVAGADLECRIGQSTPEATHLIKVACECATGQRAEMQIFGDDYPTRDGTCVRDYIHVEDLARAHVAALDYLSAAGESQILNCGYGAGYTVQEVVDVVREVSGIDIDAKLAGRRAGDPATIVADNAKIKRTLDWTPRHDDLSLIVQTALAWEQHRTK